MKEESGGLNTEKRLQKEVVLFTINTNQLKNAIEPLKVNFLTKGSMIKNVFSKLKATNQIFLYSKVALMSIILNAGI
jgi:hypothetical protein